MFYWTNWIHFFSLYAIKTTRFCMPTDEIEVTTPSQPEIPAVPEPTTPSEFYAFNDDPIALFPGLREPYIPFSSHHSSSPLPSIEELLGSSSEPVLNQKNSPWPKRKASNTLESIENLGFDDISNKISVLDKKISELEAKRASTAIRRDRNECNRISAMISRDRKTLSGLQDKLQLRQNVKTICEKDKLIEMLQDQVAQQAKIIQDLRQQLEIQPSKRRRTQL